MCSRRKCCILFWAFCSTSPPIRADPGAKGAEGGMLVYARGSSQCLRWLPTAQLFAGKAIRISLSLSLAADENRRCRNPSHARTAEEHTRHNYYIYQNVQIKPYMQIRRCMVYKYLVDRLNLSTVNSCDNCSQMYIHTNIHTSFHLPDILCTCRSCLLRTPALTGTTPPMSGTYI